VVKIDSFRRLARRLGLKVVQVYRRPHVTDFQPPDHLSDLKFRLLAREELAEYAEDEANRLPAGFVQSSLAKGDVCIGAMRRGVLLGYTWWTNHPGCEEGGRILITIAPTDNYGYKGFVRPEHRGQGIYDALVFACGQTFIDMGKTHTTYVVGMANSANLKVQKKVGVKPVGIAGYARIFGHYLTFRTPGARAIGFGFSSLLQKNA
jgi:GNAT superfamily N-acetyltransferase